MIENNYVNNSLVCDSCVFPFEYKGTVYKACTDFDHSTFWCSTKVDGHGKHVYGYWEPCGPACLKGKNLNSLQLFSHPMNIKLI